MLNNFLVVEFFGSYFDLKALTAWVIIGVVYYYRLNNRPENIELLHQLNTKIDILLNQTK